MELKVLMYRQMEELQDWCALQPTDYLAPVKSLPGTNYRWLYESQNGTAEQGGILVETNGVAVRRVNGGK